MPSPRLALLAALCLRATTAAPPANSSSDLCRQPPPPDCFKVTDEDLTLVLRTTCAISDWVPHLTLQQGPLAVGLLGVPAAGDSHVFPLAAVPLAGAISATAALELHCVQGLDSSYPEIRGTNDSQPVLDSPIFGPRPLALPQHAKETPDLFHPVAYNRSQCQSLAVPHSPGLPDVVTLQLGRVQWVHLVGDSNMLLLHVGFCIWCGAKRGCPCCLRLRHPFFIATPWLHHEEAWLGYIRNPSALGASLSAIATPHQKWFPSHPATLTMVSLGSHTVEKNFTELEQNIPPFLQLMVNRTTAARLIHLLVLPVCLAKIPKHHFRTHRAWEHLVRNNFRIDWMNHYSAKVAAGLGVPSMNLFSPVLSAGCARAMDAVHYEPCVYHDLAAQIGHALRLERLAIVRW